MVNYYVYKITEKTTNKMYIGSRHTSLDPQLDIGINYFSSSTNKDFISKQKQNRNNYIYDVLYVYNNKSDMIKKEIELHNEYCVDINEAYYNKVKQRSNGFCTSSSKKVYNTLTNTYELVDPNKINTDIHIIKKEKLSYINVYDKVDCKYITIHKELFNENKDRYHGNKKGLVSAVEIKTGKNITIDKITFDMYKDILYVGCTKNKKVNSDNKKGMTGVYDLIERKTKQIDRETYINNKHKYIGVTANIFEFYDNKGILRFTIAGNLITTLKTKNIPIPIKRTITENYVVGGNKRSLNVLITNNQTEYIGWYCKQYKTDEYLKPYNIDYIDGLRYLI